MDEDENVNSTVLDAVKVIKDSIQKEQDEKEIPGDVEAIAYEGECKMNLQIRSAKNGYVISVNYDNEVIAKTPGEVAMAIKELLT